DVVDRPVAAPAQVIAVVDRHVEELQALLVDVEATPAAAVDATRAPAAARRAATTSDVAALSDPGREPGGVRLALDLELQRQVGGEGALVVVPAQLLDDDAEVRGVDALDEARADDGDVLRQHDVDVDRAGEAAQVERDDVAQFAAGPDVQPEVLEVGLAIG